jgi:predicted Zn-dependent protease
MGRARTGAGRIARVSAALPALVLAATAAAYPIAEEKELGERFAIEAGSALSILRDPEVVDYVNRLGLSIVAKLDSPQPFDYRFQVVRSRELNAFAVPGGFVFVNSGLLSRVANDAELAGVLGHEIAHSHAHHIVRQQEQSQLANYAGLAGLLLSAVHPAIGAAAVGASAATQLKYQRGFEQEADYLGMRYVREAGFDPHAMPSFLKRIWEDQRGDPLEVPPYLLSHPLTDERITNLEAATRNVPEQPGWRTPSFALERVQAIVQALDGGREDTRLAYEKRAGADPRGRALAGIVLLAQGDAAGARAALEQARSAGMTGLEGDLGWARFREGNVAGAIVDLKARAEAAPDDAVARAHLGAALLHEGDYTAARTHLEAALARAPWLDEAEYDLGQSYGRSGDNARGLFHLARAAEMRGDVERALANYEKAEAGLPAGSAEAEEAKVRGTLLTTIVRQRVIGRRGIP